MPALVPVNLSGGSGSHLWPLSRELYPKQLLPLIGNGLALLLQTASRLERLDGSVEGTHSLLRQQDHGCS